MKFPKSPDLRAAIKSMAPIEVQRAKQALGIGRDRFDTFDELMEFILADGFYLTPPGKTGSRRGAHDFLTAAPKRIAGHVSAAWFPVHK